MCLTACMRMHWQKLCLWGAIAFFVLTNSFPAWAATVGLHDAPGFETVTVDVLHVLTTMKLNLAETDTCSTMQDEIFRNIINLGPKSTPFLSQLVALSMTFFGSRYFYRIALSLYLWGHKALHETKIQGNRPRGLCTLPDSRLMMLLGFYKPKFVSKSLSPLLTHRRSRPKITFPFQRKTHLGTLRILLYPDLASLQAAPGCFQGRKAEAKSIPIKGLVQSLDHQDY